LARRLPGATAFALILLSHFLSQVAVLLLNHVSVVLLLLLLNCCRLLAMAQAAGLLKESLTGLTLQQFFDMHCSQALLTSGVNVGLITSEVAKLGLLRELPAGQRLFSFGDVPDSFFLILKVSTGAAPVSMPFLQCFCTAACSEQPADSANPRPCYYK
jgi:hypothetical protein